HLAKPRQYAARVDLKVDFFAERMRCKKERRGKRQFNGNNLKDGCWQGRSLHWELAGERGRKKSTKRPARQRQAFTEACIHAVKMLAAEDADLLVAGNYDSPMFPQELLPYTTRQTFGKGGIKVN